MHAISTARSLSFLAVAFVPAAMVLAQDLSGEELFRRRWVSHDTRSPSGDGLGPMHNATSCVACHNQGGAGGGGTNDHNVEWLSVRSESGREGSRALEHLTNELKTLHPGFLGQHGIQSNVVLHRFGPEGDYFSFRARLLGLNDLRRDDSAWEASVRSFSAKRKGKGTGPIQSLDHGNILLLRTERNTPALWGAGLIDTVQASQLHQLAEAQEKDSPGISGRVPVAKEGEVGRFGWRGQTATLREFVLAACANELGLQTEGQRQALNPLAPHYKNAGNDLSAADADALVKFVAQLPQPAIRKPRTAAEREALENGARAFERIGCSACHPRQIGVIDGIFSDLLLHDMGAAFADPVEPNPPTRLVAIKAVGYSGGGNVFKKETVRTSDLAREWRTPPLWGVADSAPYLHDGRAKTLADAIKLHGGEARAAQQRYLQTTIEERTDLLFFLNSFEAPRPNGAGGR